MMYRISKVFYGFYFIWAMAGYTAEHDMASVALSPVRLVLDFGPWKTGSSSLCAHLKRDQRKLRDRGVMYAPLLHQYRWAKGVRMRAGMNPKNYPKDYFLQIAAEARRRGCGTVIIVNENFFNGGHCTPPHRDINKQTNLSERLDQVEFLYKMLTKAFSDISLSCRVREVYSWVYSAYWQSRKHGMWFSDLKTFAQSLDIYSARMDWPVTLAEGPFGPHMTVLNFHESCKQGLYLSFLKAHGLGEFAPNLSMAPLHTNQGVTLSAANLFESLRQKGLHIGRPGSNTMGGNVFPKQSGDKSFYYYDVVAAATMYEKCAALIKALNKLIQGDQLPTEAHIPSGKYREEWPHDYVHLDDMQIYLTMIQRHGLHKKPANAR